LLLGSSGSSGGVGAATVILPLTLFPVISPPVIVGIHGALGVFFTHSGIFGIFGI
jgi:hypothetical protein